MFGFKKGSIVQLGTSLVKIIFDPELNAEQKIGLIMDIIRPILGYVADLSQIAYAEKKAKKWVLR